MSTDIRDTFCASNPGVLETGDLTCCLAGLQSAIVDPSAIARVRNASSVASPQNMLGRRFGNVTAVSTSRVGARRLAANRRSTSCTRDECTARVNATGWKSLLSKIAARHQRLRSAACTAVGADIKLRETAIALWTTYAVPDVKTSQVRYDVESWQDSGDSRESDAFDPKGEHSANEPDPASKRPGT